MRVNRLYGFRNWLNEKLRRHEGELVAAGLMSIYLLYMVITSG